MQFQISSRRENRYRDPSHQEVKFQILVPDSLQNSSKVQSPNNSSARQSSVGTLLLGHNQKIVSIFFFFLMCTIQVLLIFCNMIAIEDMNQNYELSQIKSDHYYQYQCYSQAHSGDFEHRCSCINVQIAHINVRQPLECDAYFCFAKA